MEETPRRKARGLGRVAFIAILPAIKTELAEGYTAKLIFEKHADKLVGKISYPQFVRYVRPLREASPLPTKPIPTVPRELSDVIAPAIPATGTPPHARYGIHTSHFMTELTDTGHPKNWAYDSQNKCS